MSYPAIAGAIYSESWGYDFRGNLASHIDPEGKVATFEYDLIDRMMRELHVKAGIVVADVAREYDGSSNLLTVFDKISKVKVSFTNDLGQPGYDVLRRLTHVRWFLEVGTPQEVMWKKVSYVKTDGTAGYDDAGNLIRMVDPEGHAYDYAYNNDNRLTEIKRNSAVLATMTYYVSGQRKEMVLSPGGVRHRYHFNGKALLTSIETAKSDGTTLARYDYEYDERDRRKKARLQHLQTQATYTYNCHDWLMGETWTASASPPPDFCNNQIQALTPGNKVALASSPSICGAAGTTPSVSAYAWSCTYDAGGNRATQVKDGTSTTYQYNEQNSLTQETTGANTTTYAYDRNGNLVSRTLGTTQELFGHDYMNRLRTYQKVVSGSTTVSYLYRYAPTGERIAKVDLLISTNNEEWFMYDGQDATADYLRTSGSQTYTLQRTYVNGRAIDSKIARIDAGPPETTYFYAGDALGTAQQMVSTAGVIERHVVHTAWGEKLPGFGHDETPQDRHGFTLRERDDESGLMHFRARSYDPRTGRFIQRDPLLENRTKKHYVYAANEPISKVDPLGLDEFRIEKDPDSGLQIVKYINEGFFGIDGDPVDIGIYDSKKEQVYLFKQGSEVVSVPFNVLQRGLKGIIFDTGPGTTEGWYDWAKAWRDSRGPGPKKSSLLALHAEFVRPPNWENQYQGFVQAVHDAGWDIATELFPQGKATAGLGAFLGMARRAKQVGKLDKLRGPAAKKFDWDHILQRHSAGGKIAQQRTTGTVFEGLTEEQIKARVVAAWKNREKVTSQQDLRMPNRIKYRGVDPVSKQTIEMWFNEAEGIVETAYPVNK